MDEDEWETGVRPYNAATPFRWVIQRKKKTYPQITQITQIRLIEPPGFQSV